MSKYSLFRHFIILLLFLLFYHFISTSLNSLSFLTPDCLSKLWAVVVDQMMQITVGP